MLTEQFLWIAIIFYGGLGVILVLIPGTFIKVLGLPKTDQTFYARMLGGGQIGTAIAIILEAATEKANGLGLTGLIAMTLTIAALLISLLILQRLTTARRGRWFMWLSAIALVAASLLGLTQA